MDVIGAGAGGTAWTAFAPGVGPVAVKIVLKEEKRCPPGRRCLKSWWQFSLQSKSSVRRHLDLGLAQRGAQTGSDVPELFFHLDPFGGLVSYKGVKDKRGSRR